MSSSPQLYSSTQMKKLSPEEFDNLTTRIFTESVAT